MVRKKTVRDIDVSGKRVLVRVDFNVPLDKEGKITDDKRIRAALPTLEYLREKGAAIILVSHLGRPKGRVVEELRLRPVAVRLEELLGLPVKRVDAVTGPEVEREVENLRPRELLLLENSRFEPGETSNDPELAKILASYADIFVNDAFGAAHRAHASTEGVAHYLPAVAGLLMERELEMLGSVLENPGRPFTAVLGGNKVSDKLGVINKFLDIVDNILAGGGMCFTLLRAKGFSIGNSIFEEEQLESVQQTLEKAVEQKVQIYLPTDVVVAERFAEDAPCRVVKVEEIPEGWMGLDIGPETIENYRKVIGESKTIFWNGPMGVFEWPAFERGTREVASAVAESGAVSVVGGGDSSAALKKFGLEEKMTFVSTGGGASMEFLEGKRLPGVEVLLDA
jgi:phosphoglycerate kinase